MVLCRRRTKPQSRLHHADLKEAWFASDQRSVISTDLESVSDVQAVVAGRRASAAGVSLHDVIGAAALSPVRLQRQSFNGDRCIKGTR